jgi:chromosome segregation ATPase
MVTKTAPTDRATELQAQIEAAQAKAQEAAQTAQEAIAEADRLMDAQSQANAATQALEAELQEIRRREGLNEADRQRQAIRDTLQGFADEANEITAQLARVYEQMQAIAADENARQLMLSGTKHANRSLIEGGFNFAHCSVLPSGILEIGHGGGR